MEPDRFELEERLFHEAMAVAPAGRRDYVERAANGDRELAGRLHRMIGLAECAEGTLAVSPAAAFGFDAARNTRLIGATIGNYQIVDLIGEGGFGTVYRAEQQRPVRRNVAMKILKGGMDSERVIARFEAERQALAVMEHPSIARVFDAGQTDPDQGARPFFVMELVTGEPITTYCDRHRLDWKSRLELFITVCSAVQHAHQKGIIHRDLKPSNVLVTEVEGVGGPLPKIIDFGIAKVVHQAVGAQAQVTQHLEMVGTPQYMSPEQAGADGADGGAGAIDTRTDIYSLGALLFELLTGTTPLDASALQSASYSRLQQMICEDPVERPSSRMTRLGEGGRTIAHARDADLASLRRRLRGDLDWIVLKALEKDRERRYQSASEFANDLRRHLNHEPVEAGPPTAAYRVRKFVRRHRLGVTAATLIALALAGGAVVATFAMIHAQDSASEALEINQFMNDVLTSANPDRGGAEVRLAQVLGTASANASLRFAGHPEIEAQVRNLLGRVFLNLDMSAQATAELKQAADLVQSVHGPDDRRTLEAQLGYVKGLLHEENGREAERVLVELIPRLERAVGPNDPMALAAQRMTGRVHKLRGRYKEAEETLRAVRERATAIGADDEIHVQVLDALIEVLGAKLGGGVESDRPLRAEMEVMAREMMQRSTRRWGPEAMLTIRAHTLLAELMLNRGDARAAAEACQIVLALSQERLGACHGQRQNAMAVLAQAINRLGDHAAAADLRLQLIECTRAQPTGAFDLLVRISDSLPYLDRGGRWVEGEALAREFGGLLHDVGGGHGDMGFSGELYIARFVSLQGRLDEAETMYQALLAREDETAPDSFARARLHAFYGGHLTQRGQYEEAERHLQTAAGSLEEIRLGTSHMHPDDVIVQFIALYLAWGKADKVEEYQKLRAEALRIVDGE